jgi:hypothetical protein
VVEDLVGGLGPDEGLAALVVAVDGGADRGGAFFDVLERSANRVAVPLRLSSWVAFSGSPRRIGRIGWVRSSA